MKVETSSATLTVEECGRLLGISRQSAYRGVREGSIPVLKVGRRLLVPRAALERLLQGGEPDQPQKAAI